MRYSLSSNPASFWFVAVILGLTACDGSTDNDPLSSESVTFQFKMHNDAEGLEDFRVITDDPMVIANARDQLAKPPNERNLHITGAIAHGDGGFNLDWNWHFIPDSWGLAEVSIELCDTSPTMISQCVDCWVDAPGGACPWGSYVAEEIDG